MSEKNNYSDFSEYKTCSELKKLDFIIKNIKEHHFEKKMIILEIGCGKGNISLPLASLGYDVLGIDLNPDEITYVNKKNQFNNAHFIVGDAETIEDKGKYNIIICSEIFEHLTSPQKLSEKLPQLLNKNGLLIVTIPNGYGPFEILGTLIRYIKIILRKPDDFGHKQNFSKKRFLKMFHSFSLYKMEHSDFIAFLPIIKHINWVRSIDCRLADLLPHYLVSGWYFVFILKD